MTSNTAVVAAVLGFARHELGRLPLLPVVALLCNVMGESAHLAQLVLMEALQRVLERSEADGARYKYAPRQPSCPPHLTPRPAQEYLSFRLIRVCLSVCRCLSVRVRGDVLGLEGRWHREIMRRHSRNFTHGHPLPRGAKKEKDGEREARRTPP